MGIRHQQHAAATKQENVMPGLYKVSLTLAKLPVGAYTIAFTFTHSLVDRKNELSWYDKLTQFRVFNTSAKLFAGYPTSQPRSYLASILTQRETMLHPTPC